MDQKDELKKHFKKFDASPLLFIGSGMSKRYLGVECWEHLLDKFCTLIKQNPIKLKSQANGDLPRYATLLSEAYSEHWWDLPTSEAAQIEFKDELINSASALKIEISRYLSNVHNGENLLLEEIELLKKCNIDGVITTNWDLFLESLFPQFSTFIGQDGLITGRSHGVAEIYKIHGCSSKPNSLILTEEDYSEYRRKNPYLSSKLLTFFIERPVVFLGYSLTDEHIAEILEDIVKCFPEQSLTFLKDKLIFVDWIKGLEEPTITDSVIHKTLPVKLIRTDNYSWLYEVLSETKKRIPAHVFRTIKDELYELVLTDDPKGQLLVRDQEDISEQSSAREIVVGYGAISKVKKAEEIMEQGLVGLERSDLLRDVIFESKNYDPEGVVNSVFSKLAKGSIYLPIFHYLKKADYLSEKGALKGKGKSVCEGVKKRHKNTLKSYQLKAHESKLKSLKSIKIGVNELYQECDLPVFFRMLPFMNSKIILKDLEELKEILKKHIDDFEKDSDFVKCVCVYDQIKNSNKF